ncbi:hypothetical protein M405DRAFT_531931 [Rhizopogon salebrosus TDB-379]|nr:hypothetical protein M405DRAFT_531931 [Rhizopogon salebrosus TDB-379]
MRKQRIFQMRVSTWRLRCLIDNVIAERSFIDTAAMRSAAQLEDTRRLWPRGVFDDARDGIHSSATCSYPHSSANNRRHPFRIWYTCAPSIRSHRSEPYADRPMEFQQRPRQSVPCGHRPLSKFLQYVAWTYPRGGLLFNHPSPMQLYVTR